jgi:DNA-directed RNA polymerase subunit E'/Rpb7
MDKKMKGRDQKDGRERKEKDFRKSVKDVYSPALISKQIVVEVQNVGSNIKEVLENIIRDTYESKCILEGYIRPGYCNIITYSSGIVAGNHITFEVEFECQVCFPVEGQLVQCTAKNITKAGIRGESSSERPTPFVVFVARDHQVTNPQFNLIEKDGQFVARVIGQRFELNDPYIGIIAELVDQKKYKI